MDYKKADKLLEKYFAGETSLSEEKWLRDYFSREENAQHDQEYASEIFRYFRQEASVEYATGGRPQHRLRFIVRIAGIAAALLILVATLFFLYLPSQPVTYAYINGIPVTDKELAIGEAEKVFSLISDQLSRSTTDLSHLNRLSDIENKFNKQE